MRLVGATNWFIRWPFVDRGDPRRTYRSFGCRRHTLARKGARGGPAPTASRSSTTSTRSASCRWCSSSSAPRWSSPRSAAASRCDASCAFEPGPRPGRRLRPRPADRPRRRAGGRARDRRADDAARHRALARRAGARRDRAEVLQGGRRRQLESASVKGMVAELRKRYDDRFSHYFGPKALEELKAATSGEFSGVGLTVTEVKRGPSRRQRARDTPGPGRRDQAGDLIVAVDGEVDRRRRPPTSPRRRSRASPGPRSSCGSSPSTRGEPRDVDIERAQVRVPAVDGEIARDRPPRRQAQGRLRPLRHLQRGRARRAARGDRAALPPGRRRASCSTCAATAADCSTRRCSRPASSSRTG